MHKAKPGQKTEAGAIAAARAGAAVQSAMVGNAKLVAHHAQLMEMKVRRTVAAAKKAGLFGQHLSGAHIQQHAGLEHAVKKANKGMLKSAMRMYKARRLVALASFWRSSLDKRGIPNATKLRLVAALVHTIRRAQKAAKYAGGKQQSPKGPHGIGKVVRMMGGYRKRRKRRHLTLRRRLQLV